MIKYVVVYLMMWCYVNTHSLMKADIILNSIDNDNNNCIIFISPYRQIKVDNARICVPEENESTYFY